MRWGGNDWNKYGKKLQKQVVFDEITCFCWSEMGDSNSRHLAPKGVLNTFYAHLQRFLVLFNLFYLLFDALISTVSECSSAVCGNLCGQNASRPISGEDSPVPDGKRFSLLLAAL